MSHEPDQSGSGLSFLEAMDPADDFGHRLTGAFRVVVGLKIDPALRVSTEERAQALGRVDGGAAQTLHDFVDAPGWHRGQGAAWRESHPGQCDARLSA